MKNLEISKCKTLKNIKNLITLLLRRVSDLRLTKTQKIDPSL